MIKEYNDYDDETIMLTEELYDKICKELGEEEIPFMGIA